jgi:hypothetical protein
MNCAGYRDAYKGWSIVVTTAVWPLGEPSKDRVVPSVAVIPPSGCQQHFVEVDGGAAFLGIRDACQHGMLVAKRYIDAQR